MSKILVTGATGLIGKAIVNELLLSEYNVVAASRNLQKAKKVLGGNIEHIAWDGVNPLNKLPANVSAVIHLAGASVAGARWNDAYKNEILTSRTKSTSAIRESFVQAGYFPEAFICSSATGIYGSRGDEELTESSVTGHGFLADVCTAWEKEAAAFTRYGCRTVSIRTGIVLDKKEGAFPKLLQSYMFYIQAVPSTGKQWFSWIHKDDITALYLYALTNKQISGPMNGTAPEPVTMGTLYDAIGSQKAHILKMNIPDLVLRIALGESAIEIVKSQRVIPEAALRHHFAYKYPTLQTALSALL